ncbi:MAG: RNA polymerase sigma factor [Deltaproteobacteria bacterium]|nr:RNA polymerase sigma factor [Deltaproteobacteria bacterium]
MAADSDESLLFACGRGDSSALEQLFDRHSEVVWRFLSRMLSRASPDVDDLVQQTFIELWRAAARFRGGSSAQVFILGIAHNLARAHLRKRSRRQALDRVLDLLPIPRPKPLDEAVDHHRLVGRVAEGLAALSVEQRTAFLLVDLEGMRSADAAQTLGVNQGTFGRRLFEARRKLRSLLEDGGSSR